MMPSINLMIHNPIFSVLRTANANALVLFFDGTHGVFLCADVDAAYARMGTTTSDLRALPSRATKRQDCTWVPSNSEPKGDPPLPTLPAPPRPPLLRTYAEFQQHELSDPTRYLGYDEWDLLSPMEFCAAVKDWAWNPETGHTPPVLADELTSSSVYTPTSVIPGARPQPTGLRLLPTLSKHTPASLSPPIPANYPLVLRAPWWMLEDDPRSDAEADADWRAAMERLFPPTPAPAPPLPAWRQAQITELDRPPLPPSRWPPSPWGSLPAPDRALQGTGHPSLTPPQFPSSDDPRH
jgi:hypothetical protein